jgi:hypothetical protein
MMPIQCEILGWIEGASAAVAQIQMMEWAPSCYLPAAAMISSGDVPVISAEIVGV